MKFHVLSICDAPCKKKEEERKKDLILVLSYPLPLNYSTTYLNSKASLSDFPPDVVDVCCTHSSSISRQKGKKRIDLVTCCAQRKGTEGCSGRTGERRSSMKEKHLHHVI